MLSKKNISPKALSFLASGLIAIGFSVLLFIITHNLIKAFLCLIIAFGLIYLFLNYIIDWLIFRKLKLIYKLIYSTKANKKQESYYKYVLPKKTIEDVQKEVENWAINYEKELEIQQKNETFRKEFLQNLSHELKTPIFGIQGYLELIIDDLDDNNSHKKYLIKAQSNVERIRLLLKDIDEISSLETGERPLTMSKFIVQEIIKEVFDNLSLQAQKRNIKQQIKKGCEANIYVYADKEKIKQVIYNLVTNAIKYSKINGSILAGIYYTDEKNILIEITDDGIGIDEEHIHRIFERFYRTDDARSRNIGGSGLGLSICKHIVEAHGFTMHARSQMNVGTTIGFTLSSKK